VPDAGLTQVIGEQRRDRAFLTHVLLTSPVRERRIGSGDHDSECDGAVITRHRGYRGDTARVLARTATFRDSCRRGRVIPTFIDLRKNDIQSVGGRISAVGARGVSRKFSQVVRY
jgi:hypothetical protein